jgi:hypothetical protein
MHWEMWPTVGALAVLLVVLAPVLFRLSRTTWLSLFVKYDKDAQADWESEKEKNA